MEGKMKNKSIFIIITIFVFTFLQLKSQDNSSFLGKRVSLNFSGTVSPAWMNPSLFSDNKDKIKLYAFNFDICPNVEVIIWKEGSVGVVYHWYKTKFSYSQNIWIPDDNLSGTGKTIFLDITPEISVQGFGIYYKQYLSDISFNYSRASVGNVRAPIGTYMRFQYDNFSYSTKNEENIGTLKGNLNAAKIEIGHDYIFFDKIRFSTGLYVGATFCKISKDGFLEELNFEETIKRHINNRLFFHYLAGASVSIGFFIF